MTGAGEGWLGATTIEQRRNIARRRRVIRRALTSPMCVHTCAYASQEKNAATDPQNEWGQAERQAQRQRQRREKKKKEAWRHAYFEVSVCVVLDLVGTYGHRGFIKPLPVFLDRQGTGNIPVSPTDTVQQFWISLLRYYLFVVVVPQQIKLLLFVDF